VQARGAVNDDIDLVPSYIVYGTPSGVDLLVFLCSYEDKREIFGCAFKSMTNLR
jgi:hypothetical protein